jgi:hypothetical protein
MSDSGSVIIPVRHKAAELLMGREPVRLGECLRGGGYDLVVWYVAKVLADVPAVSKRIVELAVPVAPEHVLHRLSGLGSGRDRLCEDRVGVGDIKGQDDRCAADRGWGEDAQLGELVREMQPPVTDPEHNRHQSPVGRRDSADLLGAESITVEGGGALGARDNDVWCDRHEADRTGFGSAGLERCCRLG